MSPISRKLLKAVLDIPGNSWLPSDCRAANTTNIERMLAAMESPCDSGRISDNWKRRLPDDLRQMWRKLSLETRAAVWLALDQFSYLDDRD